MQSSSQTVQSMFQTMLGLKEVNTVLSKRLVQLFEIYFPQLKRSHHSSDQTEHLPHIDKKETLLRFKSSQQTKRSSIMIKRSLVESVNKDGYEEDLANIQEEQKTPRRATPNLPQLHSASKLQARQSVPDRVSHRGSFLTAAIQDIGVRDRKSGDLKVTPSNISLLASLFEFTARCTYHLDTPLINLLENCLCHVFSSKVVGFAQNDKVRVNMLRLITKYICEIVSNQNLQSQVEEMVTRYISDPSRIVYKSIEHAIKGKTEIVEDGSILSSEVSVASLNIQVNQLWCVNVFSKAELRPVSLLARYLTIESKRHLVSLIQKSSLFSQANTAQDEHPDLKQSVAQRKNHYNLILNILQNILRSNEEKTSTQNQDITIQVFTEADILSDQMLNQLRNICLSQFQKLFEGHIHTEKDFQTLMEPYCALLFQLISMKESRTEHRQRSFMRSFNQGSNDFDDLNVQDPEEASPDLTVLEVFILVIKTCLNKVQPDISIAQLQQVVKVLLNYCETHLLQSSQGSVYQHNQSENLLEVFETLTVFAASIDLQGVNQGLFNSVHREGTPDNSSSCKSSDGIATTRMGTHQSASSLKHYFANMSGAPLFEEAIASLLKIEMAYLRDNKLSYAFGSSASKRLISKLVSLVQSMAVTDENLPKLTSYTASLMRIVMTTLTEDQLSEESISSLQNQVGTLLQRVFQCFLKQADTNLQMPSYLKNVLRLALVDLRKISQETDQFELFLEEFRKLFQRRSIQKTFADLSSMVFSALIESDLETDKIDSVQRIQFFGLFVELLESILVQNNAIFSDEQLLGMIETLTDAISIDKAQLDKLNHRVSKTLTDQLRDYLSRLWLLIASQTDGKKLTRYEFEQALCKLAALTPAGAYSQEYLQIQSEAQKNKLDAFCGLVFEKFEAQVRSHQQDDSELLSVSLSQSHQNSSDLLSSSQSNNIKKSKKSTKQAKQEQDEPEMDEELELRGTSDQLQDTEKVYLAMFIFVQTLRFKSQVTDRVSLPFIKHYSICSSIITTFENESSLIVIDFNDEKSSGQKTEFCKSLEASAKQIFTMHLNQLFESQKRTAWNSHQNMEVVQDFNTLVIKRFGDQALARDLASQLISKFEERFPNLILHQNVLDNILDVMSASHTVLSANYDGKATHINLALSKKSLSLPVKHADRLESLQAISKLLQSMVIKGVIISQETLWTNFQKSIAKFKAASKTNLSESTVSSSDSMFGVRYLEQIKGQLDLSKVEISGRYFKNFHSLRRQASEKPVAFSKIVSAHVLPYAFNRDKPMLLDLTKLLRPQALTVETFIRELKPFPIKIVNDDELLPVVSNQTDRNMEDRQSSFKMTEQQVSELIYKCQGTVLKINQTRVILELKSIGETQELQQFCRELSELECVQNDQSSSQQVQRNQQKNYVLLKKQATEILELAVQLSGGQRNEQQVNLLIQYLAIVVICELEAHQVYLCKDVISTLKEKPQLLLHFLHSIPTALNIMVQNTVGERGQIATESRDNLSQGTFNVTDKVKQTIAAKSTLQSIQKAISKTILATSQHQSHHQPSSPDKSIFLLEQLKLIPTVMTPQNLAYSLLALLQSIFDTGTLTVLTMANHSRHGHILVSGLTQTIITVTQVFPSVLKDQIASKLALLTIKAGLSLYEILAGGDFNNDSNERKANELSEDFEGQDSGCLGQALIKFIWKGVMRSVHMFNYRRDQSQEFMEEMQLIEDVSFLMQTNNKLFEKEIPPMSVSQLHDISRSTGRSNQAIVQKGQRCSDFGLTGLQLAQVCAVTLQSVKLTLIASNYDELETLGALDPLQLYLTQQQANGFAQMLPKVALCLAVKHPASFKLLLAPVLSVIEKQPRKFMKHKDALHFYLKQKLQRAPNSTSVEKTFSFWRLSHILHLAQFLSFKHSKSQIASSFALKPLYYAEPKIVIFYLPQLFQAMRYDHNQQIVQFLLKRSKESASIAHNVLWFCKVESRLEETGRKVTLPCTEILPELAQKLYNTILSTTQMSQSQRAFFETETAFFEKITSISGLLQPSQSKDEKKAIIREKLIEYNKEIPECVYLPTNQTCKVVGIVTSSGQPMQSAARVPILISFEVEAYPGPDRDPVLAGDTLVTRIARQKQHSDDDQQLLSDWIQQFNHTNENLSNLGDTNTKLHLALKQRAPSDFGADIQQEEQDNTLCHKLENYQMNIKVNYASFQSNDNASFAMSTGNNNDEKRNSKLFGGQNSTNNMQQSQYQKLQNNMQVSVVESRKERELLMLALSSQLKGEPAAMVQKEDSTFALVANMLANMQDAIPKGHHSATQKAAKQAIRQGPTGKNSSNSKQRSGNVTSAPTKIISCIFKVNDDLRQDILALQVIKLFQKIFKKCDLDLYVVPYKCISNRTGSDKLLGGLIECIPNSYSRDQLGKAFEIDLHKYFLKRYGNETSPQFQQARLNFTKSLAAYCVVSYILQIKDRHNGNIMIDESGHLIHIDFGFIFDWSPGRDMRFESANFKLTQEFIDILGGDTQAEAYKLFVKKVVQGFLAVREHADEIQNLVELMWYSGFPCFKQVSLENLEYRFRKDLNDYDAAKYMHNCIQDAHDKWTTRIYDFIQSKQNKIFF